jgi:Uma2 family endonuclease
LPDDGKRYECIDGELLVTPSQQYVHQFAIQYMYNALREFVSREQVGELMWSPADIELETGTTVAPDLFVIRAMPGMKRIRDWPDIAGLRLAVEVLSPSTARYDRGIKRLFYQRAEVEEYWIVDLDARLVERWQSAATRPEILRDRLAWAPAGASTVVEIDLLAYFASLLDEPTE